MYPVQAYHCSHCKVFKLRKSAIVKHEKKCFHNPETMSCATCLFYDRETVIDNSNGSIFYLPICHKGADFFPGIQINDVFHGNRPRLKTNCPEWIERPEDEDEKIISLAYSGFSTGTVKVIDPTNKVKEPVQIEDYFDNSPF